jgi:stage II sporulation protein D
MDHYLCGLLSAEIPLHWPAEALKAQVVAARTYAIWKKINSENSYDLVASTLDQVYNGIGVPDPRAAQAVRDTSGWVIVYRGEPILAYYHSCCGGHTDTAWDIKKRDLPYVRGVPCPWCADSPKFRWRLGIPAKRLSRLLTRAGFLIGSVDEILPIKQTPSGRIVDLEITSPDKTLFLTGEDLRKALGYQDLKSARFLVRKRKQTFVFTGSGYGHGLGACQWGMKGMADHGHPWHQILRYYYRGVEFRRLR